MPKRGLIYELQSYMCVHVGPYIHSNNCRHIPRPAESYCCYLLIYLLHALLANGRLSCLRS